jgi:hypothetical protein
MSKVLCFLVLSSILGFTSCNKDSNEIEDASDTGSSSHNTGKNCQGCHSFKVAGSVFSQSLTSVYKGATIKITSAANGDGNVLATLTSDRSGNFYTNSSVNFGSGVFISITGSGGPVRHMTSAITSGACNSCHNGSSTSKLWAE